jgi:glycosyltransferase involved in cell wall biosynthesis
MNKPKISICIPTFNDVANLKLTLDNITKSPAFIETNDIEVVISDNNSNNETQDLCKTYSDSFKNKFAYFKNDKNLGDLNFGLALSRGSGSLRKLHNTYFQFNNNALFILIKLYDIYHKDKPVIFLTNKLKSKRSETIYKCNNLDDFLLNVSFISTWIGGFFIWEEDFISTEDFSVYSNFNLSQTEVLFRTIAKRSNSLVINEKLMTSSRKSGRGGYNIAEVFAKNYLNLIKKYIETDQIQVTTYEIAKKRVLLEHILPSLIDSNNYFESDNLLPYLLDYQFDDYFYHAMLQFISIKKSIS